jgi:hypothetical protein
MSAPQFIAVLHRKLKPHCTYEDFYQAWLPPGLNGKDPTKEAVEYFKGTVQVINAVNSEDPTEIISIGILWGNPAEVGEEGKRARSTKVFIIFYLDFKVDIF